MNFWISLLNDVVVSLFGSVLSAVFCNALDRSRNRRIFWVCVVLVFLVQCPFFFWLEEDFLVKIYPVIVHLPLLLLLYVLTGKVRWPLICILFAYLCCQPRRWVALFFCIMFSGGTMMQDVIELVVTVPLMAGLLYAVVPAVRHLSGYPVRIQYQFGIIPALYYGFDYLTRIYTNILSEGMPVAVEFMPFVSSVAYLVFLIYYSAEEEKRIQLDQLRRNLDVQLAQAVLEIDALRESQVMAVRYRHDLRHHLQYVSACIENGQEEQAQIYISEIFKEIEAQKVQYYCENEAVNLILSSFAGRAKKEHIGLNVQGNLSASSRISDSDLCVLLSNALENAIHACLLFADEQMDCSIDVQFYERNGKLFLQITNPCKNVVCFKKGIPVSEQKGHGIGVQSICAIVERYGGIYDFLVRDGRFMLRLSI